MDLRPTIGAGSKTRRTCRGARSVYANISPILCLHRNRQTPAKPFWDGEAYRLAPNAALSTSRATTALCVRAVVAHFVRSVKLVYRNDNFSLGMSFFKISDCLRDLTQRVTSIDHRFYFPDFKKFLYKSQILFVRFRQQVTHFLTPGH